jgi:SAM-dependent methyltransferase
MYPEIRTGHNWLIHKALNDKVRERLPAFNGQVLDLGCGTRPFEADILRHAREYIGVDWSNTLHGNHADIVADLNQPLPIATGSVDHIISLEVLEHLAEPRVMLSEAFRILRSRGQLTLSVPFQWWIHEEPWDYFRYTRHGLRYLLEKAGFADIRVSATTGFWSMWVLKLNYQLARWPRGPGALRTSVRMALIPFWWLGQHAGPMLDRVWPEERETAGYFVTAVKP